MKPILTIKVPSKRNKDIHTVSFFVDKSIKCDCVRKGLYKMNCNHILEEAPSVALQFLEEVLKLKDKAEELKDLTNKKKSARIES